MTPNFTLDKQCDKAANEIIGMIDRNFRCKMRDEILPLYKSFVKPHLETLRAGIDRARKDTDKLEKVQRRVTRMVKGLEGQEGNSYEDRLRIMALTILLRKEFCRLT